MAIMQPHQQFRSRPGPPKRVGGQRVSRLGFLVASSVDPPIRQVQKLEYKDKHDATEERGSPNQGEEIHGPPVLPPADQHQYGESQ
jgi:hypothetical protein